MAALANAAVRAEDMDSVLAQPAVHAAVALLALETSCEVSGHAEGAAHRPGRTVVRDPGPASDLPQSVCGEIDVVAANQCGATRLTKRRVTNPETPASARRGSSSSAQSEAS
jgi:ribokinase